MTDAIIVLGTVAGLALVYAIGHALFGWWLDGVAKGYRERLESARLEEEWEEFETFPEDNERERHEGIEPEQEWSRG
jgi:hypothetical protein